jgi:fatty-acyl-CoA synthase
MSSTPDVNLAVWLGRRAARTPWRPAVTFKGLTWTYADLDARVDALASQLLAAEVAPGDRVAFVDLNHRQFLVALFATARVRAVFVPLNFRLTSSELAYALADSGPRVVIAGTAHRALIDDVRDQIPAKTFLAVEGDEPPAGWVRIDDTPAAEAVSVPAADGDDIALIMYTSGTTGRPKGACLTHANLWWNNVNAMHNFDVLADDVTVTVMPLFHIGGLNVLTLPTLQKGGHVILHRQFDAAAVLGAIAEHRVTTMMGVPAIYQAISDLPAFADADLSSFRMVISGAAPCPLGLLDRYAERGIDMQQGYGMTETSPMVTFLAPEFARAKAGSAGTPALYVDLGLLGGDGSVIEEAGQKGEIVTRGPNVMLGYWNRPDETAEVLDEDGWLRTGDVAYRDEDGFYFICDRIKDMIITGGENVYPAEVENVLAAHPAIAEVAVIGVPHEQWGETVVAVAALRSGHELDIATLREWATASLARYKLPTRLEIVPALPRNATGKVLKFQLRDKLS